MLCDGINVKLDYISFSNDLIGKRFENKVMMKRDEIQRKKNSNSLQPNLYLFQLALLKITRKVAISKTRLTERKY